MNPTKLLYVSKAQDGADSSSTAQEFFIDCYGIGKICSLSIDLIQLNQSEETMRVGSFEQFNKVYKRCDYIQESIGHAIPWNKPGKSGFIW